MLIRISQADTFVQEIPTVPRNDRWDRLLEKLESIEEVVYDKTEFDNRTEAIRHGYLDYIFGYFWCLYCVLNNWKSVNELCKE